MKTSLQIRSLRAAGLALDLGLGLAAASRSAQAATVQITLNRTFTMSSTAGFIDVTGQSTSFNGALTLNIYPNFNEIAIFGNFNQIAYAYNQTTKTSGDFSFKDARINNGATTSGKAEAVSGGSSNSPNLTLTRVVFDNASTVAPSFNAGTTYPEWSPTSTAVPEPGTFIPAAVLVAGALLRRRRSRSHRSGRATA